jgi:GNAT superfamily N-acetyltransferase
MVAELSSLPEPDPSDLDWDSEASPQELGRVNDLAYGYPEGEGLAAVIGQPPAAFSPRSYRARSGGRTAAVLQTVDLGSDCAVWWVATLPEERGRGLASRLLSVALAEARERGMETTSLQASMLGRGVYERVGYELVARLRLHERRLGSAG